MTCGCESRNEDGGEGEGGNESDYASMVEGGKGRSEGETAKASGHLVDNRRDDFLLERFCITVHFGKERLLLPMVHVIGSCSCDKVMMRRRCEVHPQCIDLRLRQGRGEVLNIGKRIESFGEL